MRARWFPLIVFCMVGCGPTTRTPEGLAQEFVERLAGGEELFSLLMTPDDYRWAESAARQPAGIDHEGAYELSRKKLAYDLLRLRAVMGENVRYVGTELGEEQTQGELAAYASVTVAIESTTGRRKMPLGMILKIRGRWKIAYGQ